MDGVTLPAAESPRSGADGGVRRSARPGARIRAGSELVKTRLHGAGQAAGDDLLGQRKVLTFRPIRHGASRPAPPAATPSARIGGFPIARTTRPDGATGPTPRLGLSAATRPHLLRRPPAWRVRAPRRPV